MISKQENIDEVFDAITTTKLRIMSNEAVISTQLGAVQGRIQDFGKGGRSG